MFDAAWSTVYVYLFIYIVSQSKKTQVSSAAPPTYKTTPPDRTWPAAGISASDWTGPLRDPSHRRAARRRVAPFKIISRIQKRNGAFCCGAGEVVSLKGFDLAAIVAVSTEADAVVGTSVF